MSYALLWVEALLTSLLWVAAIAACAAHVRRKWVSRLALAFAVLIPFALFGAASVFTAILKFNFELDHHWFGYALSLLLAYLIGVVVLSRKARRSTPMGTASTASPWPRSRLALGLLTVAAVTMMTLWNMDLEAGSQAANLRIEAGAMMLSVSPPNVSDSRNGAFVYEKAFARLAADDQLKGLDSPLYTNPPDEKHHATAGLLKRHELTIKLLRKAAAMPEGRFDHDYAHPSVSMLLPEIGRAHTAADFLWLDARNEKSQGHVESAIADVNAIFHLSKTIGDEPILISLVVSVGVDNIATEALQDVLPAVAKQDQLSGLEMGEGSFGPHNMARTLEGEEAFGLSIFSDLGSGQMNLANIMAQINTEGSKWNSSPAEYPAVSLLVRVFLIPDDVDGYRELLEKYRHAGLQPFYKNQAITESLKPLRRTGLITSTIAPAFRNPILAAARGQAMHACAQVAIAMTRYRLDHGSFPAALDPLVPNYLDEVPQDPFDGKPLRLVQKGDEWIIYSVGPDGKDDGGVAYDSATKKGDLPFVLKAK